jgi:hypothetical protein
VDHYNDIQYATGTQITYFLKSEGGHPVAPPMLKIGPHPVPAADGLLPTVVHGLKYQSRIGQFL